MRAIVALVLAVAASPALAEIRDAKPEGFTLENSITVPVDAKSAWRALVDDVGRWWPKDHTWWGDKSKLTIDARAGGCFCEIDGKHQAQHMLVVMSNPPELLRMRGALGPLQGMGLDGVLEFRLAPAEGGEGTNITMFFRIGGYTPDDLSKFAPVVDSVQGQQIGGLKKFLEK